MCDFISEFWTLTLEDLDLAKLISNHSLIFVKRLVAAVYGNLQLFNMTFMGLYRHYDYIKV